MRSLRIALLLFLIPALAHAQGGRARGGVESRRDTLEALVLGRFITRASVDLSLNDIQTRRLRETLRSSALQRRALNQQTMQLRRSLADAIRRPDTRETVFSDLLAQQQRLRREEQRILEQEQAQLQQFLTPRQRAHFLMLWARLQDDARQLQARPPGGPPG